MRNDAYCERNGKVALETSSSSFSAYANSSGRSVESRAPALR